MIIRNMCEMSDEARNILSELQKVELDDDGRKRLEELGLKEDFERESKKFI